MKSSGQRPKAHFSVITLSLALTALPLFFVNCSGGEFSALQATVASSSGSSTTSGGASAPAISAGDVNVMAVTVGCGYVNEPCVTVTICAPGSTTNCQTIPNVLVDTGSYGLRLFHTVSTDGFNTAATSLLSLTKTADPANSANVLAECISYADGSSDWGPIAQADVLLGSERAAGVPIQIIDSTFGRAPSGCTDLDTSPVNTGFNGILGVGLFLTDCGADCTTSANNGVYYSCPASGSGSCAGAEVALDLQVSNPVASLETDNNGVILELASIPLSGVVNAGGSLVFGLGTRANNSLSGATTFNADTYGNFVTMFNGQSYSQSFIDSGSNGLFFPTSSVPACTGDAAGFFCPTSELNLTAQQTGADGGPAQSVSFNVGNAADELSSSNPNYSFSDLAGSASSYFDWGLPFFYGRAVAVGIENASSSLGTGPLWAY